MKVIIAEGAITEGSYDVVTLDEIFIAVNKGPVSTKKVLDLMRKRPEKVELVLTDRGMPMEVIKQADMVTRMAAVKHPFTRGSGARKGIEC